MAVLAFDNAPGAAKTLLGAAALSGQTVTSNQPVINVAQTWNNAGVVFDAVRVNVVPSGQGAGSRLIHLQSNSVTRLAVDFVGGLYNSSDAYHFGDVYLTTATPRLRMGTLGDARIGRAASGSFTFDNNGSNSFNVTAGSQGVAGFSGPARFLTTVVALLPTAVAAGAGARAFVTDATMASFNAGLTGGGAHSTPVFSDGVVWRVG
jgi:hypothetical protein